MHDHAVSPDAGSRPEKSAIGNELKAEESKHRCCRVRDASRSPRSDKYKTTQRDLRFEEDLLFGHMNIEHRVQ